MFDIREKLSGSSADILQKKFGISTEVLFDVAVDEGRGDLTTSVALQLGKKLGKKPHEIADVLAKNLGSITGVERVDIAGPGYVNVVLKTATLVSGLSDALEGTKPAKTRTVGPIIIDYSSPNIAKPLGVHHILSTCIGQVIANLCVQTGTPLVRWNYIGDWGTQYGKLAVAYELWGKGRPAGEFTLDELLSFYVRFHDEAEKKPELEQKAQETFRKLEQGDKALRAFWKDVVGVTKRANESLYKRLGVSFDLDLGESEYEDKMAAIIDEGKKKGVFKQGEKGALIVEFPEEQKLPPALVLKSDGGTIYLTRDLALMRHRIDQWHPSAILHVVDVAQSLYFRQLFATAAQLGWELPSLEHVQFGRMRFADKAMSTRKGNIVKLEEAMDEAVSRAEAIIKERGESIQTDNPKELAETMGIGALVYGVLSQNRKMDIVFDWDKVLSFEGNSAPYLQYTHARARSVMRKGGVESFTMPKTLPESLTQKERSVLKLLLRFQETVHDSLEERAPHRLATYLYELCQAYNSFYNADEILTAPDTERLFRLSLTSVTASVLKTGANLLSLRVPERM